MARTVLWGRFVLVSRAFPPLLAFFASTACSGNFVTDPGESGGTTSSGGAGTGGGAASGGTATGGDGSGGSRVECTDGSVTFELSTSTPESHCTPGCTDPHWLSIADPYGKVLVVHGRCTPDCTSCATLGCPDVCDVATPVQNTLQFTWDGTTFANGTCGESALACHDANCAEPGSYVATLCLRRSEGNTEGLFQCLGDGEIDCTTIEFEWPETATHTATL